MSVELCCDFCGRPLPKIMVEIQGDGFGESAHANIYFTKELNTKRLYPHLCENCAMKLDEALKYARGEWIKQLNISSRNAEINKERREKLGTKG